MSNELALINAIKDVVKEVFGHELEEKQVLLQATKKEFKGNLTFVTFPLTKALRMKPEDIGQKIGESLKEKSAIEDFNVVKGFLNLELKSDHWIALLQKIGSEPDWYKPESKNELHLIEYSSPNTNKPLHLGHLRNNFLGWSVSEIMKTAGYDVKKVQIINDRGIHICKSMLAWQKFGEGETPESSALKGDKLVGKYYVVFDQEYKKEIESLVKSGVEKEKAEQEAPLIVEAREMLKKWEEGDKEVNALWEKMNSWVYDGFNQTYTDIGVDFDKLYYESQTYLKGKDIVLEGVKSGLFYQKEDNSVWADLESDGLDKKLLLRSDGTSVYMTQDIGTAILRNEDYPGLNGIVYTVGNEQEYHFKVLFLLLKKLGYQWSDKCFHLSYGMVDLPSGKMKSREGTVVDADDLLEEMIQTAKSHTEELGKIEDFENEEAAALYKQLALGALKFFLLKVDPKKRMLFDPQESIQFQGHTGPFVQYTHARISALIRRAMAENIDFGNVSSDVSLDETEQQLSYQLSTFPEKVEEAAKQHDPSIIASFVFELAKEYNRFYANSPIFNEADKDKMELRILLSYCVAQTIKNALGLLGIDAPEKM